MAAVVFFGGVFARLKSNLVALLSPTPMLTSLPSPPPPPLATQQLFSHITYTPCVPDALFTDLRVSTPITQALSITVRILCSLFVVGPSAQVTFGF